MRRQGKRIFSYNSDPDWLQHLDDANKLEALRVTRVHAETGEEIPVRTVYYDAQGWKDAFSAGVVDLAPYTVLEIGFEIEDPALAQTEPEHSRLEKWVKETLSKFVALYQQETSETDVFESPWSASAAAIIDTRYADKFRLTDENVDGKFGERTATLRIPNPHKIRPFKPVLKTSQIRRLANRLKKDEEPAVYLRLFNEARELALLRERPDIAIVVIGTALEVYLKNALLHTCTALGIEKLPVYGRLKKASEAIDDGNVRRDLLEYVKQIGGSNPRQTPEYTRWFSEAYEPRNDIMHGGARGHEEQDARNAFEATMDLIATVELSLANAQPISVQHGKPSG